MVCAAVWDFAGPIVVPYVVTNGVGCNVVRLLSVFAESKIDREAVPAPAPQPPYRRESGGVAGGAPAEAVAQSS